MAVVGVSYQPNPAGVARFVRNNVLPFTDQLAQRTARVATRRAPEGRSGRLKQAHHVEGPTVVAGEVVAEVVNTAPYALFVHEGTRTPIKPRRANALRIEFEDGVVFAAQVRGQEAQPWMLDALGDAVCRDRRVRCRAGFDTGGF